MVGFGLKTILFFFLKYLVSLAHMSVTLTVIEKVVDLKHRHINTFFFFNVFETKLPMVTQSQALSIKQDRKRVSSAKVRFYF